MVAFSYVMSFNSARLECAVSFYIKHNRHRRQHHILLPLQMNKFLTALQVENMRWTGVIVCERGAVRRHV